MISEKFPLINCKETWPLWKIFSKKGQKTGKKIMKSEKEGKRLKQPLKENKKRRRKINFSKCQNLLNKKLLMKLLILNRVLKNKDLLLLQMMIQMILNKNSNLEKLEVNIYIIINIKYN